MKLYGQNIKPKNLDRIKNKIKFILYLLLVTSTAQTQQTLIRAGRLIDTNQKTVKNNIDILVEGNRIIEVGKNLKLTSSWFSPYL